MYRRTRSEVRGTLLIGAVALAALVVTALALAWLRMDALSWVVHSRELAHRARTALIDIDAAQAGVSDYLLSGTLPSTFAGHEQTAMAGLDTTVALTSDNAQQHAAALAFRNAAHTWFGTVAEPALHTLAIADARADVEGPAGRRALDDVQQLASAFLVEEERLYSERLQRVSTMEWAGGALVVVEAGVAFGILVKLFSRISGQFDALESNREQLEQQAVELEEQTAELEDANQQLENTLREAQRLAAVLDAALDSAPIGYSFYDLNVHYTRVNPALARMTGVPVEQHAGKTLAQVRPKAAAQTAVLVGVIQQVIDTREPILNYAFSSARDENPNDIRHFLITYYPIILPSGELVGVGSAILDVTEQRHLTDQLLQAQKMEAVGRLAGGVAHDFNNVLSVITAYAELLLAQDRTEAERADVTEIQLAAQRGSALTRQLLAFSRKQIVQIKTISVNETVRGLEQMLRRLIPENIRLVSTLRDHAGFISADKGQIEQVVMNLVINAADAMPSGGDVTVETARIELGPSYTDSHPDVPPGSYTMIAVTDTGIGMDAHTQRLAFEPYFTTKEMGRGTGLGLATVYGITKRLNGHVWVYSELGHGASFKIYFPRVNATEPSDAEVAARTGPARGTETVLLVEDDDQVRRAMKRMLERSGYTVLEAEDGFAALDVAASSTAAKIDVVLTDLMMPGMNGRALADELLKDNPDMRIVFMSGYTSDAVVRRGLVESAHAFIQKPARIEEVTQTLRAVLDEVRR